jgi:hypothetical protein
VLAHKSFDDRAAFIHFFWQATAIMVEDHVIDLGKAMGLKDSKFWRTVGFVWTTLWFGFSTIAYTNELVESGIWIHAQQVDFFGVGPKV